MKRIIGLGGLAMLIATAGCEIEEAHYSRGGYHHGYYGEYPDRYYGHSDRDRDYRYRYPYDRDHYWYRY